MAQSGKYAMLTLTIFDAMSGWRGKPDYETQGLYDNPLVVDVWGRQAVADYYAAFHSLRAQWHEGDHAIYLHQLFYNMPNNLESQLKNARRLWEAGVPLLIGTDAPGRPASGLERACISRWNCTRRPASRHWRSSGWPRITERDSCVVITKSDQLKPGRLRT